ncbi:MAG TPA: SDR family NAD(P)-dependent oxidoreductase, partial [Bacteroidia bacterium]|nr:SDR family NAD(P)-dependent oxidoreductase [Bacteroidia bacterium]
MNQLLQGKVIVVTGGAGLLGKAFCSAICESGGTPIVADKNEKDGRAFVEELNKKYGRRAHYFPLDITSESSIETMIETVHNEFGYIDALVNNAYPRNKNYGRVFEEVT